MNQKGFINIIVIVIAVILAGAGAYFVLNQQAQLTPTPTPTPTWRTPASGPITVNGEITCLPKKGTGSQTMECAIGLKDFDGRYYGLKDLFKLDPEYKFSVGGLRVEVSGSFNPEEMKGPDGNKYDVVGTIDVISIRQIISPTPTSNGEKIIRKIGEKESSFLIKRINPDSVEGLWYDIYPIERPNDPGSPKTLYIGDDIGYSCEGVSEKLTSIDFSGQAVTFTKIVGQRPYGGCPICLAGNTLIDTPSGLMLVKNLQVGMSIWTIDKTGHRVSGIVTKTSKVPVPLTHQMVHLILDDGRELFVSPGHPTVDERNVGDLTLNDLYDGASVVSVQRVPYGESATYDVLPSGETGFYWANGVLLGSTLSHK